MDTLSMVFNIAICVVSAALVLVVLLQKPKEGAGSAIMGQGGDTYYDKIKGKSTEGKLMTLTKVFTGAFVALIIVAMFI